MTPLADPMRRVTAFHPDGSLTLEDGTEMQALISETGALGARPKTDHDRIAGLDQISPGVTDQTGPAPPVPTLASLGLDQA